MKKSKVHILIVLILITSGFSAFFTYSKYFSSVKYESGGKVAIPIISNKDDELLFTIKPGEIHEYEFGVSNQIDDITSEVTMKYRLKLEALNNLPLEYELYTFDNNILGDSNILDSNNATQKFDMPIQKTEIINKYKLIIKWKEDEKNYLYSKETEYIKIETIAEQVD